MFMHVEYQLTLIKWNVKRFMTKVVNETEPTEYVRKNKVLVWEYAYSVSKKNHPILGFFANFS